MHAERSEAIPVAATQACSDRAVHFVGFRGEEYWSAVKIWGKPDFYHRGYDNRMRREVSSDDVIVFANGYEQSGPKWHSYPDIVERYQ